MKISIIIPTRERAQYLRAAIKSALAIEDDHIEVIVSDNASSDLTKNVVEAFIDPRLAYFRTEKRVSMRQNFEFALSKAKGEYLIFIGDDDAILPGQFPALRSILQTQRPDSLSWPRLTYKWPNEIKNSKFGRILVLEKNFYGAVGKVDTGDWRKKLLNASVVWDDSFPALYHGAVSRACLEHLTLPGKEFFQCKTPDVYFSYLGLLKEINNVHANHSFSLSGNSPASTGGSARNQWGGYPEGSPAARFVAELAIDPFQMPFDIGDSVPGSMLETLEAVLAVSPSNVADIDYNSWYHYVLYGSANHFGESWQNITTNLVEHAKRKGILDEYRRIRNIFDEDTDTAKVRPTQVDCQRSNWLATKYERWQERRRSFKLFGAKTAFGAASLVDRALSRSYLDVLSGVASRKKAWINARQRAKSVSGMDLD